MAKVSLRLRDTDLEAIDRRADEAGLSRTALMLRAVLGATTADEQRFAELEDRIERLEQVAGLGAFE